MNKWIKIAFLSIISMTIAKLFENYFVVVFVLGLIYGGISTYEIEDKSLFKFK
jgi:chromate transport protein ChrA